MCTDTNYLNGEASYVNQAAFCTITSGAVGTVLSVLSAASSDTMKKTAAYGTLAVLGMTGTISAATAWLDPSSKDVKSYLKNVSTHFCYGVPAMATMIANRIFEAALDGVSRAIREVVATKVQRAFS